MKFDFSHFGSDACVGDTISRLPILDWYVSYKKRLFEYKHAGAFKNGFTGAYKNVFYISVTLFRHKFNLYINFAFGQTTPELAFREYHNDLKTKLSRHK